MESPKELGFINDGSLYHKVLMDLYVMDFTKRQDGTRSLCIKSLFNAAVNSLIIIFIVHYHFVEVCLP